MQKTEISEDGVSKKGVIHEYNVSFTSSTVKNVNGGNMVETDTIHLRILYIFQFEY